MARGRDSPPLLPRALGAAHLSADALDNPSQSFPNLSPNLLDDGETRQRRTSHEQGENPCSTHTKTQIFVPQFQQTSTETFSVRGIRYRELRSERSRTQSSSGPKAPDAEALNTPCRYDAGTSEERTGGCVITRLEIGVLGDLVLSIDGVETEIGAPKERQLLAVLAIHKNTIVSNDRLIEALWPEDQPKKPLTSLRAYVSNLRRTFEKIGAAGEVLTTETGGYSLRIDPTQLDSHRFEATLAHVQSSDEETSATRRAEELDRAMALVRGNPLADMTFCDFAHVEIRRLDELVVAAEELRAELAIDSGHAAEWLPRIGALVTEHPLRERIRASHMRALAMSGRHSEALRSYSQHRDHLIDEMGLEPGPEIRRLEAEILALDDVELSARDSRLHALPPDLERAPRPSDEEPSTDPTSERRLVTVVAIDLAEDEGAHSDPEDLQSRFEEAASGWSSIIERHGGRIQASTGTVLLALFGLPIARERDAERAVVAALEVVAEVPSSVAAVATSLVIAERSGEDLSVVGSAITSAQRMCSSTVPGAVSVDAQTRSLTEARVLYEAVADSSDGVAVGSKARIRDGTNSSTDRPLIDRDEELLLIRKRFDTAMAGEGHTVVIEGDAGIGKTRLVDALLESIDDESLAIFRLQCSPLHQHSVLHPVVEHLEDFATFAPADTRELRSQKWQAVLDASSPDAHDARHILGRWVLDAGSAIDEISVDPDARRAALLRAIRTHIESDATRRPTICIVEDTHWIDPSTRDLLDQITEHVSESPMLLVITHRTGESDHDDLPHTTRLKLSPLSRAGCVEIARNMSGERELPSDIEEEMLAKTDGIPLFVEEMTQSLLASSGGAARSVPASLQQSLAARLDRIPDARAIVQLASALGSAFDLDLLASVAERPSEEIEPELDRLCEARILRRGSGSSPIYRFRHILVRDVAHESLPRAIRADHHRRIAETLELVRPDVAQSEPGLVAQHWRDAGDVSRAVPLMDNAAQRALAVSALSEAIQIASEAIALIEGADELERSTLVEKSIDLRLTLGVAQMQLHGPASVEAGEIYKSLFESRSGDFNVQQLFKTLWGQWYTISTSREPSQMTPLANELYAVAVGAEDRELLLEAHHVMWSTLLLAGDFQQAVWHTDEAETIYTVDEHHRLTYSYGGHDPGTCMWGVGGLARWLLGQTERGAASNVSAIELADQLSHPYSRVEASFGSLVVGLLECDSAALRSESDVLDGLVANGLVPAATQGYADGFRGAAHIVDGNLEDGYALLAGAAESWREFWGGYGYPLDGLYAEATAARGDPESALGLLDAILVDQPTRPTWWDSELLRVRAHVLALLGRSNSEVFAELESAAQIAGDQGAVMLELRVTTDHANALTTHALDSSTQLDKLRAILSQVSDDALATQEAQRVINSR